MCKNIIKILKLKLLMYYLYKEQNVTHGCQRSIIYYYVEQVNNKNDR